MSVQQKVVSSNVTKEAEAAKIKKTTTHPKFIEMIQAGIKHLNEKTGSSRIALMKYIVTTYSLDEKMAKTHLRLALIKGVKDGVLKQVKGVGSNGSFKLVTVSKPQVKKVSKPAAESVPKPTKKSTKKTANSEEKPKKNIKKIVKPKIPKAVTTDKPVEKITTTEKPKVKATKTVKSVKAAPVKKTSSKQIKSDVKKITKNSSQKAKKN